MYRNDLNDIGFCYHFNQPSGYYNNNNKFIIITITCKTLNNQTSQTNVDTL
jgi:hypothetical protein